jgi:hypothetical protein
MQSWCQCDVLYVEQDLHSKYKICQKSYIWMIGPLCGYTHECLMNFQMQKFYHIHDM